MSGLQNSTFRCVRAALVVALMLPGTLLAVTAARQSRMMVVHVRDSSDSILDTFRFVAVAAGLGCHTVAGEKHPDIQCVPSADGNLGIVYAVDVYAVDVTERKQVVVSAFSSNLVSPQGELDLSVAAALLVFRRALEGNPNIVRIDECMAPNHEGCSSN
jgi:hypothetical protein